MTGTLDALGMARGARPSRRGHATVAGAKLLVVDPDGCVDLCTALRPAGVVVSCADNGGDALVLFGQRSPDAVLLAPRLPDLAAADLVVTLRRFGLHPVLLGVGPEDADVAGPVFVAGATAAVSRPYDADEITARLAVELPPSSARGRLTFGPLCLDAGAHTVHVRGVELDTVPLKEFELLRLLMTRADQVVSPQDIRVTLWGDAGAPSANAIAVHANRLRSRLPEPVEVRTVRGLGYRLTLTR